MGVRDAIGVVPPTRPPSGRRSSGGGRWRRPAYGLAIFLPLVALLTVVFVGPVSANTVIVPGSASNFESGDGNMTLDTTGDTDWNCFVGTTGFQAGTPAAGCKVTTGATQTAADATGETKLTSGTKFDDPCVTFTTSNTPPKDDFTNIAEYSDVSSTGDTYLYAAAIRATANGNASGNVEFNQATNGCRTAGDKLLAYDFLNGGTSLSFTVLTWITSGACDVGSASAPCWSPGVAVTGAIFNGESNQAAIAASDNGINGQALAINQFLEFGADLTKTLGLSGCTSFPQNVFESRSSGSSFTSNPEDVEVQSRTISTCGRITIIKQSDPRGQNQVFNFTSGSSSPSTLQLPALSTAGGVACSSTATAGVQADGSFCLNDTGNAGKLLGSTAGTDNSTGNTIDETSVPRGTYSVTEGTEPAGYVFESLTCSADASSGSTGTVSNETATIVLNASGHVTCLYTDEKQFQPSLSTTAGTSTTASTTSAASCPAIPSLTRVAIGTNVCDTASLTGTSATGVAGTVTYTLYPGTGCTGNTPNGTSLFTSPPETVSSTGTVPNSATTVVSNAGMYQWQAVFMSSNSRNLGATSPCGSETFTVGPNSPTIATTAGTGSGVAPSGSNPDTNSDSSCTAFTGSLSIGTNVCDTATLSGFATSVAGTVTYTLYFAGVTGTTPNANGCSTSGVPNGTSVFSDTQTAGSTGTIPNSADFKIANAGNYQWQAAFTSTNGQNNNATSPCGTEQFTVGPQTPTLTTAAGTGGKTPSTTSDTGCATITSASLTITTNVCDTASLSGTSQPVAGTVTYKLYYAGTSGTTVNPNTCSSNTPGGTVVFTDVETVGSTGNVPNSADFTIISAGNYQWQAVFTSTNAQNNGATSACSTEEFLVGPNAPTLTTTAGTGSGVFPSGSPDAHSDGSCAAITGSLAINTNVCDTATLNGTAPPVAGTVTYTLYFAGTTGTTVTANSCGGGTPGGTAVFTDVQTVGSTGSVPNSSDFKVANAGNYQWQAVFSSTNAQNVGATSTCGTEPFAVGPNSPTLATTAGTGSGVFPTVTSPDGHSDGSCVAFTSTLAINTNVCDTAALSGEATPAAGTVTYTLYYAGITGTTPNANGCGATGVPNGTAVFTDVQTVGSTGAVPNSADYTAAAAGNYQWQAVFTTGNAQNNGATSPCGTEPFTVGPSAPTVTTTVGTGSGVFPSGTTPDGNTDASCAGFTGNLSINAKACDTAVLNGAATPVAGTVTYTLYYAGAVGSTPNANSCSAGGVPNGMVKFTDVQTVAGNGSVPNSTDVIVTSAGNYQWQVAFTSTNAQNLSSVSTCLSEPFTVAPNNPTFSTAQNLLPNDSSNLTGATSTAGGSLTFDLYNPTNTTCSGTGDYHEVVTVSGNSIYKTHNTTSTTDVMATAASVPPVGEWRWQVVYSGDLNNTPFTVACGVENFTIAN